MNEYDSNRIFDIKKKINYIKESQPWMTKLVLQQFIEQ